MIQEGLISRFDTQLPAFASVTILTRQWARIHRENLEEKPEIMEYRRLQYPNYPPQSNGMWKL